MNAGASTNSTHVQLYARCVAYASRVGPIEFLHPRSVMGRVFAHDGMVLLGEPHLRAAIRAFVDHYHEERPHQGLGNELIAPKTPVIGTGPITCRERLGGLLKFYHREAA